MLYMYLKVNDEHAQHRWDIVGVYQKLPQVVGHLVGFRSIFGRALPVLLYLSNMESCVIQIRTESNKNYYL